MIDLVFGSPPYAGGPVDLVFGATGPGPTPDPLEASATVSVAGVIGLGLALYDNRNPARRSLAATVPHDVAQARELATPSAWGLSARRLDAYGSAWDRAESRAGQIAAAWRSSAARSHTVDALWRLAANRAVLLDAVHQAAKSHVASAAGPWLAATPLSVQATLVHQAARSYVRSAVVAWQLAARRQALAMASHGTGRATQVSKVLPWQVARVAPPGRSIWTGGDTGAVLPRVIDLNLVFSCPPAWLGGSVDLLFGRVCALPTGPLAPLFILPARFYMAVHTLIAHRMPDLVEIPIFDVSLSADAGSFAWTFSASGPVSLFDALAPAAGLPAQIRITLDGIQFVFVVDSLQREERFGKRGVRISGRSATALLARPYARETDRVSTEALTAQQIALGALEFTGADLDWGLTDWLVPAGAWSHNGTPLAAVQAIVEAAGGYLQSHRSAATLLARHPYPELPGGVPGGPWNWGGAFAADVELAPDALMTQSIERRDGPDINGVYVSGTSAGVLALVKRTGTAADKLSSLVTDPLITSTEVAMQRGLGVLGAAGQKHLVQIELPVLTGVGNPGVLDVGQLVQINETTPWRGRVRSVSVNANMPKARQTVALERHLEAV